jgi:hypothetical protein
MVPRVLVITLGDNRKIKEWNTVVITLQSYLLIEEVPVHVPKDEEGYRYK